ncbi:MAG: NfeD family protein [Oscillospiraceae bacterium]|nr:NfeD family protein [Oscillospiraceae bacterium]
MVWIWLGVTALSLFVEAVTLSLVSVWCAVGALISVFVAYAGAAFSTQLLVFVSVSLLTFAAVRPLTRRFVDPHIIPTNADRLLGLRAKVTEEINNETPSGAVYIDGKIWTARSAEGEIIPKGELVEITCMEGVKLMVVRAEAAVSAA